MVRPSLPALLGAAALLLAPGLCPAPARAHAIESSLEHLHGHGHNTPLARSSADPAAPEELRLISSFSTGAPVVAAAVRAVAPSGGEAVELGRTDAEGRLVFRLPSQVRPDWELQVDGGPGHRDYLELPGLTARAVPTLPRGEIAQAGRQLGLLALIGSLGLGGLALRRRHP
jgi:nickel transport protein